MTINLTKDKRFLRQIEPSNILSFGPDTKPLDLENLNVLIGPNGAGKSNLIEVVALMRATPKDVRAVIREGGGAAEWIWKGSRKRLATVKLVINYPKGSRPLRHLLSFYASKQGFRLNDERIEDELSMVEKDPSYYYSFQDKKILDDTKRGRKLINSLGILPDQSILSFLRAPAHYPEISYLSEAYNNIRIYREWEFGRNTVFREPQKADMRNDRLEEDFSNLGLYLNKIRRTPHAKAAIIEGLRDLYEGLNDFDVSVEGGTVQVFFTEGNFTIPATRLSDGSLRYLCLLAILYDPEPHSLICIEEPELGLHPDILPKLADHLKVASSRTQIIITTHSDVLVDSMTETPEAVVVCERHEGQTVMRRLKRDDLADWLKKYKLGQLWTKGELGGTRW